MTKQEIATAILDKQVEKYGVKFRTAIRHPRWKDIYTLTPAEQDAWMLFGVELIKKEGGYSHKDAEREMYFLARTYATNLKKTIMVYGK